MRAASHIIKEGVACMLQCMWVPDLFRRLNRGKLLTVAYHGVTRRNFNPPVWTQLSVEQFSGHLAFLKEHYRPVSLTEVNQAIAGQRDLPERAVLVTFDDGLRNNYTNAFPLLVEFGIPAAIFLPVEMIGSDWIFWFDELYLILQSALFERGGAVSRPGGGLVSGGDCSTFWESYRTFAEDLKHAGDARRGEVLGELRRRYPLDGRPCLEDFGLLDWDHVAEMERSGLVEFGVHTATHRILSELAVGEWEREILAPKKCLEERLGHEVASFSFPNGRPGVDLFPAHLDYLREAGFVSSYTMQEVLFSPGTDDPQLIGRVNVGADITAELDFFTLNAAGFNHWCRGLLSR